MFLRRPKTTGPRVARGIVIPAYRLLWSCPVMATVGTVASLVTLELAYVVLNAVSLLITILVIRWARRFARAAKTCIEETRPVLEALEGIPSDTTLLCRDERVMLHVEYERFLAWQSVIIYKYSEDGLPSGETFGAQHVLSTRYVLTTQDSPWASRIMPFEYTDKARLVPEPEVSWFGRVRRDVTLVRHRLDVVDRDDLQRLAGLLRTGEPIDLPEDD